VPARLAELEIGEPRMAQAHGGDLERAPAAARVDRAALEGYLSSLIGAPVQIESIAELGGGATGAAAIKAFGYGRPLRIDLRAGGMPQRLVLRQVMRNGYGRERDSDRVAEVWLDYHAFNRLPRHAEARDMIGVTLAGELVSLAGLNDLLLLTNYASGQPYADDLLRVRDTGQSGPLDLERARQLAAYLAEIHALKRDDPLLWRRRLRDLIGHGEGIMGLTDSYAPEFPLASAQDWLAIESAANRWRWQLKPKSARLSQVHGDFHPFNILFTQDAEFSVLDRSRGEWGEPADDVSCLTINYLFFSLQRYDQLDGPFVELYSTFWDTYLALRPDDDLCDVIQPWYAWRALVLASPQWYPTLADDHRRALLTFARRVMAAERFEWARINQYLQD
jgi:aminoglycoside phosphotransferase (APT) family kinase protein